jgi:hypothetical protein
VTDFDAGSALRGLKAIAAGALIITLGTGLAGCESATSIFGSTPAPEVAAAAPAPVAQLRKIALTPVIGAPENIAKQMASELSAVASKHRFEVTTDRDARGEFTLRGYMVAARDKNGTKLNYIWDVADGSGKRVHRITGDEMAPASPNAKDAWAAVGPANIQAIAEKTAAALGGWLPNQPSSSTGPAIAAAPATSASGAGATNLPPPQTEAAPPRATNQTTAALPAATSEGVSATPVVSGAPGDGNTALAEALQRELSRQGVSLSDAPGSSYRVEGRVAVGTTKDGKQPVQIDWRVRDAQGKSLGTVSQKNEIPPGSLDGEWGKTADAAAAAAAQGIIKLLPQAKSTN